MAITCIQLEEGWVVIGAPNVPVAREELIDYLITNEEIDNFGVCEAEGDDDKVICVLSEPDLCPRCQEFLNTIFPILKAENPTAALWKEL